MKKYIICCVLASAIFIGFGGAVSAEVNSLGGTAGGGAAAASYAATGMMVATDLGITDVGTLPTSNLYFLKEWKRGLSRAFTWDEVKEVELELRIANEKAAEMLMVVGANPGKGETKDESSVKLALENYAQAQVRLEAQLISMKENSENPKVKVLLEKLDKQSLQHATLLNQIAVRWDNDPYAEDALLGKGEAQEETQAEVDVAQKKIQDILFAGTEKEKNIKGKAEEQIKLAEAELGLLKIEFAKFMNNVTVPKQTQGATFGEKITKDEYGVEPAGITIDESGVSKLKPIKPEIAIDEEGVQYEIKAPRDVATGQATGKMFKGETVGLEAKVAKESHGMMRLGDTTARISTNMTIERQTQKRDFGDRVKAGLEQAGGILAQSKAAFAAGKFGEAFGQARVVEVKARNMRSAIADFAIKEQGVKKVVEPGKPKYEDIKVKNVNPVYDDSGMTGTNRLYDKKIENIKMCGPQPGAPGNWMCKDGKWQLIKTSDITPSQPVACTQEAKLCADGTSVGRTGPRCEFTECPALKPREGVMCTAQYDPVCGTDGKTYSNACMASVAGAKVSMNGECKATLDTEVMIKGETTGAVSR